MSDLYGAASEAESIATIHRALDLGINLLDTGDFYGMGHNEMLISKAIQGRRDQVILSVKFGALRNHDGTFLGFDGRPAFVKNSLAYSLRRLGVDYIDFYFPSRVAPNVPIEETVGAISDLVREGKVRYIGLSEASAATVRKAHKVHPITALQIEYSLWSREIEDEVLPTVRELGVGVMAYAVLSRGLMAGTIGNPAELAANDMRRHMPRFQGENFRGNAMLVNRLAELAREKGVTVSQLAIAWVLAQGRDIVPVIGTRRRKYLEEDVAALNVPLSSQDLKRIEQVIPRNAVAGGRYPEAHMAMLNR